jgi:nucleotide-binding universal stress UspA family protein
MSRQGEAAIRRILVALDASTDSLAALGAAADLCARLNAELIGLFVEDINLLRLAELPFARECYCFSAANEPMDTACMERALKVQAEQARRALAEAAERANVRWSLRITRGRVASEILAAGVEADLITLGKAGASLNPRKRVGSTARAVATRARRSLLLVEQGCSVAKQVLAIYDGSASSMDALALAVSLAGLSGSELTVFIAARSRDAEQRLENRAREFVAAREIVVRFRRLSTPDLPGLLRAVSSAGKGMLVIGKRSSILGEEAVAQLVSDIEGPLLLVD